MTDKFSRDIDYANKYFVDYEKHFMHWSPVFKRKGGPQYNQLEHIDIIDKNIKAKFNVGIEFVVNERFHECLQEMRSFAKK